MGKEDSGQFRHEMLNVLENGGRRGEKGSVIYDQPYGFILAEF